MVEATTSSFFLLYRKKNEKDSSLVFNDYEVILCIQKAFMKGREKMIRNIQNKIVLTFFVLGLVMIVGLAIYFATSLEQIHMGIASNQIQSQAELASSISNQITQMKTVIMITLVMFGIICIGVGIFVSRAVISPINKLMESAEKISKGEKVEIKKSENGKIKNEVDELVNAFSLMNSELKEKLNEMSRQKKQIETILLHMTDGIIAFNMQGETILINPAATRALEIMPGDNTFEKIFSKFDVEINMEKMIYLENWTSSEQRLNMKDKYLNLFFAPFKDENERPAGVIVVIQDITEHVKLDDMRKEFVADVSHELKTPITSIMGYADTLMESEYDKEMQAKFLGVISSEARRMARLVTDLLSLSRYDRNKTITEKVEFDLGDLVKKCQEKLQLEINKKKQNVECFVTANVPPVYAEKDGIERVIINILTNSIKYTEENGTIKIYVGFVYNDAYIKIIDNGIGIPEADLSKIFERFYRVDKARTREMGGTGLGLSIAKEILDRNNGTIDIKSELGKGTEVVIRIPTNKEQKIENVEI